MVSLGPPIHECPESRGWRQAGAADERSFAPTGRMSGQGDVLDIGERCASCSQLDFLPQVCCDQPFCRDCISLHRLSSSCSAVDRSSVVVCPICARGVTVKAGEDPNAVVEEHQRRGRGDRCDPDNFARVHNRKRCCAAGCREKLTTVNAYACKQCGEETCVRHRMPESHSCVCARRGVVSGRGSGSGSSFFRSIKSFFGSLSLSLSLSS